ncbi:MAG: O-antigen ligase family protein [Clostridia bacterium]|nr:O-antigen ligase family protein [Clostridia bacterium]
MNYIDSLETDKNTLSFRAYKLLFVLVWTQYTVLPLIRNLIALIPGMSIITPHLIPAAITITACMALPYFKKQIKPQDLLLYAIGFGVVIYTMAMYWRNAEYLNEDIFTILVATLPMYFLGIAYDHDEMNKILYWVSILSVITMFLYEMMFLSKNSDADYNMDAAYKILPSAMYLVYWAFENKRIRDWVSVGLGITLALAYGTRGVLLALIIYIFAGLFINFIRSENVVKNVLFILFFVVVLYLLFATDFLVNISTSLTKTFENLGFSTRIFEQFLSGEIGESKEREFLAKEIIEKIQQRPLIGYGIYADRVFTTGSYVHNIFLEIWCDFGVLAGTALASWFVFVPIKANIVTKRTDIKNFILMYIVMVFTRLMLSNSYLLEANLFLMMGVSVCILRKVKSGEIE